jgi:hypothetical protein
MRHIGPDHRHDRNVSTYYTVIFWPHGVDGPEVAVGHLTRFDLREA